MLALNNYKDRAWFLKPQPCLREYPAAFGYKLASLIADFKGNHFGVPQLPEVLPSPEEIFASMEWDSVWPEADIVSTVRYLRGSKSLHIPESFRPLLPSEL